MSLQLSNPGSTALNNDENLDQAVGLKAWELGDVFASRTDISPTTFT